MKWEKVKLEEVCMINPPQKEQVSDETPVSFLAMADVSENGKIKNQQVKTYAEVKKGFTSFTNDDVIVAKITPCFENGKGSLVEGLVYRVGFGSTEFHVLRASPRVYPRYLYYATRTPHFKAAGEKNMTGSAGQKRVPASFIKGFQIPLPPLPVQKQIADTLDKADALRQKDQQLLRKYDELAQSIFYEMFGDPVRNERGWDIQELGSVVLNCNSKRRPIKEADRANLAKVYPYYGASGVIDHVDSYIFEGTHLLVGEDGANLLARSTPIAFIASGKFWVNNHAHVLKEKNLDIRFIEHVLNLTDLKPFVTGSAQPKLTREKLDKLKIIVPPFGLVKSFCTRLESVLRQHKKMEEQTLISTTLFNRLLHHHF